MNYIKNLVNSYRGLPKEIYILFVANIINAAGSFIVPLLTLILTQKIGLSSEVSGIYVSIFGIMYLPAGIIGGKLTDLFGRKKVIIIFQSLACLIYILCGILKPSLITVYLIMISGLFAGFVYPAISSMTADITTPENRNASYSFTYMGWNLGFAIGPLIGGLLFKNHLSILFLGDAATTLIALLLIGLFIKETKGISNNVIDESRGLEQSEEGSIITVLRKRKTLLLVCVAVFGYTLGFAQWGFLLPIELSKIYGLLGAKHYGFLTSFNGFVVIIMTPILTKYLSKTKNLKNILISGIFYTIGIGTLGFFSSMSFFFVAIFIFTLGEIILTTNINTYIANNTPESHRGRMLGIIPILTGAGYVIGPPLIGELLKITSYAVIWRILSLIILVSTVLVLYILKRKNQ
ncbi:MFS transporter [uncultured Clostridium sp.]|jgi:MFS family permease|uniref:MFS transporter n=1 Tax=uncultured Clostridium sp. TaxID=59620 RepID=UPI0026174521|nr:MFS transporter [uncultured Clostridium sp.]